MSISPPLELIADPTRLRLVRTLSEHTDASLADLAAGVGVHVNTARGHLRELERAGLVDRSAGSVEGRGRPAARYRLAEGWRLPGVDMLGLAELLAAIILRV